MLAEPTYMHSSEFLLTLVRHTLRLTESLLETDGVEWETGKRGVQQIMKELMAEYPNHASTIGKEFEDWIKRKDEEARLSQQ